MSGSDVLEGNYAEATDVVDANIGIIIIMLMSEFLHSNLASDRAYISNT